MSTKIQIEIDEHCGIAEILLNGVKLKHVKTMHFARHESYIEIVLHDSENPRIFLDAGLEVRLLPAARLQ